MTVRLHLLMSTIGACLLSVAEQTDFAPDPAHHWRPAVISADSAFALPLLPLRDLQGARPDSAESLSYTVRYGLIHAGVAELRTEMGPEYGGRQTIRVVGTGRSTGALDWVFQVRDHYESHVDADGLFPHRFIRSVQEGGYRLERDIRFDPERRLAITDDAKGIRHQAIPPFCQDLVSSFQFARHLPLASIPEGGLVEIPTFLDGEVHLVRARKIGAERVEVKAGTFDCWAFKPVVMEGRIWKDEDDLTVYISADHRRIPVLVKTDLLVGSLKLELVEHTRVPIASAEQ